MAQRYTSELALERMAEGLCPECGESPSGHASWAGRQGCKLLEAGVTRRIARFRKDRKGK